ncbi:alpha/beta fold hydrolase [Streptomyces sp. GESEQ-35]|uniref:alpha/beta hydrolase n=1 Tax=Streptomyces sp. GESEQ-35 TaxID=2812657 RepID=UPI001B3293B3|nr:alpha/beta hydrolase [Streptomyces sp. GESEQ-35]
MSTFVLIHGSWGGGWVWDRMRPVLEEAGHRVLTPTLTGFAEKHDLSRPEVGLSTHVREIADLLTIEEVDNAILVGHSYGGMVITGVVALVPDRISQIVYVDAFAPITGESAFAVLPWLEDAFTAPEGGPDWEVAPLDPRALGADEDGATWLEGRLTPMPLLTHAEPLGPGSEDVLEGKEVTYIHCAAQEFFNDTAAAAAKRGFRLVTLTEVTHVEVLVQPRVLARELLLLL